MLHLQESFSPAMLISPVIVSPVSVQPQVSASSRSDKVVEQLSSRLASIENEIAYAKLEVQLYYCYYNYKYSCTYDTYYYYCYY
jgi:hypothetical protein